MKKFLFYFINFTWGILQNIIGLCLFIKYRKCKKEWFHGSLIVYHNDTWGGVSLGMFIFMNAKREDKWIRETKVHEYGHCIQTLILGPLYIFAIGIPSFIWCNAKKYKDLRKQKRISYFDFYPEKWANSLGEKVTKLSSPGRLIPSELADK